MALIFTLEPKIEKETLPDPNWVIAMQEELAQFQKNKSKCGI